MIKKASFGVLLVAVLALAGALAPKAQAATVEELQAQIAALMAQLSGLSGGSSSCHTFTVDLTMGSTGAEVTALQELLVSKGYLVMPAGVPMGYFGALTKAAVMKWQAASGIAPAAGYVGPISRGALNAMCTPTTGGNTGGTTGGNTSGGFLNGSNDEGSLDNFDQLSQYSNEEVGEDEEDVKVLGVEMEAEGADQMIERVVVTIDNPTDNDDLEDFITDVSVWLDGEELGRMDVDEASYDRDIDEYTFRFTGLDGVIEEGDLGELVVAVSGVNNLDTGDAGDGWDVSILTDDIRALSPNGVSDEYDNTDYTESFTVETFASASGVELKITEDADNPDADTVQVDETDETEGVVLLEFNLEAKNSDIDLYELPFLLTISSTTQLVSDVANRLTLTLDGEDYAESVTTTGTGTKVVTFDNIDYTLSEGDKIHVVLAADLNEQDGNYDEGVTIKADLDATRRNLIDAEDETGESLGNSDKTGTVVGEAQTLRTQGAILSNPSFTVTAIENNDASTSDNQASFKITFDVEAFDQDVYVAKSATRGTSLGTAGVNYTIEDASVGGTATTTGSVTSSLTSTADTSGSYFRVSDGQTESFTLTVVYDPTLTKFYQLQLYSLNFASSAASPTDQQLATPTEDYETSSINILN